jgi:acetyl esterase/lipase
MTATAARPSRARATRAWCALACAALLLLVLAWGVVPPPAYPLLVLSVAAPEIGAWLLPLALATLLVALADVRTRAPARAAAGCALAAIALCAWPFAAFAPVHARCTDALRVALGPEFLSAVPAGVRTRLRAAPLLVRELYTGIGSGASRVVRGVPITPAADETLTLDIYVPPDGRRNPVIVQVYGGAWRAGGPADDATFARYFAARGYVVFAIDYRHAPGWRWPTQIEDVRAALAWISAHAADYGGDATRLALWGRSSGAQLALVAAYEPDALPVRAVVDFYGPVDLVRGYREPPRPDPLDVRSVTESFLGGTPDDVPGPYRDASPVTYAVRPLPPTLLVYGDRDNVVPARFGAALAQRLSATGTTAILLRIPWSQHAFDAIPSGPGAQLALYHTERFLAWALHARDTDS